MRITGFVEVDYVPDTGADHSIIPSCMVDARQAVQPDVEIQRLPILVEVTLADGKVKRCVDGISVDIALTTMAGPVHVQGVSCLILQSDEEKFLVDEDTLQSLGIDVDAMLAQLAGDSPLTLEEDEFPVQDFIPIAVMRHCTMEWNCSMRMLCGTPPTSKTFGRTR